MREGEEVLVTNWAELRIGMIVIIRPCNFCGGQHRTQLANLVNGIRGLTPSGDWADAGGYTVFVQPPCMKLKYLVTPAAVAQRLVWRVEDGVNDDARQRARSRDDLVDADRRER
jgi:hypothetical protein